MSVRVETDTMGAVEVPADAYYGAQTARAAENFRISALRLPRRFLAALGQIKAAAARTNRTLGSLDTARAEAIERAALEVAEGRFDQEFIVDVFQTGSGTSTHMNANEVIANRASELMGGGRGERRVVHPNDHVNLGQSSNDVFPTALHIAALDAVERDVLPALRQLADALGAKAREFADVVKAARTHLQDAVPITLGQEFSGYESMARHGIARIEATRTHLAELAIGGSAAGTGITVHPQFTAGVIAELRQLSGLLLRRADNAFEAMQNRDAALELSGACRTVAIGLFKLANDLRLLSSGPFTGLAEIALPDLQPGSSVMPGKVNPVIPEAVNMVAARVIGNDATIAVGAMNGTLDLNTMMPIIAHALLESLALLANACRALAEQCLAGITADRARCRAYAEQSPSLVTALAPLLGYERAAAIVKDARQTGQPIRDAIRASGAVPEERLDELLDLLALTRGGRAVD